VAIVLEDDEVPNFNDVCVGEPPPAVVEVHLSHTVGHHLHGPHADRATDHTQYDLVPLLPVNNRCELLGDMVTPNSNP
jgi:hypothetical protein